MNLGVFPLVKALTITGKFDCLLLESRVGVPNSWEPLCDEKKALVLKV